MHLQVVALLGQSLDHQLLVIDGRLLAIDGRLKITCVLVVPHGQLIMVPLHLIKLIELEV